jgi:hypothetical protein
VDGSGKSQPDKPGLRVNGGELVSDLWEGVPGAGQPPQCDPTTESGLGRWRCFVFAGELGERMDVTVRENGSIVGIFPPALRRRAHTRRFTACCIRIRGE